MVVGDTGTPLSDEALMGLVRGGDQGAFRSLLERWHFWLYTYLLRRWGSRAAAEEIEHLTWCRVWRYRETWTANRPFRPWLLRIARNEGSRAWRAEQRFVLTADFDRWPSAVGPHDAAEAQETLVRALGALEGVDREIFLLIADGFTPTEVAEVVDLEPGAVRVRLHRARARLREALFPASARATVGGSP